MVAIIDYDLGNLGSIANMFKAIGEKSIITDNKEKIEKAEHIILPGVGSYDTGMKNLCDRDMVDFIKAQAEKGKPILGICLGMQLLGRKSEEGNMKGLGLIPFDNVRFHISEDIKLKVPHMGWDIVDFKHNISLLEGIEGKQRYYFVHSYHAVCDDPSNVMMTCNYGYEFAAAVYKKNIYGVQFHPEKSHDFGMRLLENFVRRCQNVQ